jgi:hypothetical protein
MKTKKPSAQKREPIAFSVTAQTYRPLNANQIISDSTGEIIEKEKLERRGKGTFLKFMPKA